MITKKISVSILFLICILVVVTFSQELEDDVNIIEQVDETTLTILDNVNQEIIDRNTPLNTFSVWDFVRMLIVLASVLGFIYLIFFLLKKAGNPKIISDSIIKILTTQNLDAGKALHIIEIGSQVFLIGSGESSVQLISEIIDKETIDTIKLDRSIRNDENKTFTNTLTGFLKKDQTQNNQTSSSLIAYIRKQKERLRKM